MSSSIIETLPSLLVFGPHTEFPVEKVFDDFCQRLNNTPRLAALRDAVHDLPQFWKRLVDFDPSLSQIPGAEYLGQVKQWLKDGGPLAHRHSKAPSHYGLAVTFLLHIIQYSRYLDQLGKDSHSKILDSVKIGGIHGHCVGFLSAVAVAICRSDADLGLSAAIGLRLAVCIGAYVDQDGAYSPVPKEYMAVAIRWRGVNINDKTAITRIVNSIPDAYISSINDDTSVTATIRTTDLASLTEETRKYDFRIKPLPIYGRFHHQKYSHIVDKFKQPVLLSLGLEFPDTTELQVPVRNTANGQITSEDSLARLALQSTLVNVVDWYSTLKFSVQQLPKLNQVTAFTGFGGWIPQAILQESNIQVRALGELEHQHRTLTGGLTEGQLSGDGPKLFGDHAVQSSYDVSRYPAHSIAIVGMAGRFPGADSVDELWDLIKEGKTMVEPAPLDRFKLPQSGAHANRKWWGNFLKDSDAFDHKFFGKSSREALAWDPQKRILLEVVYEALESAGYFGTSDISEPRDYGCYIGTVMSNWYDNISCHPASAYGTVGVSRSFYSGQVSHYFGWTGPSLSIDTACSSSLVAINTACRAIWSGECSRAVAGGTNVIPSPFDYLNLAAAGFLSPSGQCKPFDANADGYCRGEAVSVVVLKRLSDAVADNDHIHGVIVGSAINQNHNDGAITAPNFNSQIDLYRKVISLSEVDPKDVTYFEAHGPGTGVGDPIEVRGIRETFGGRQRDSRLYFGSVKENIGHTESAAGISGLIKVLLMMKHQMITTQASHIILNPTIPAFDQHQMSIARETMPWEASDLLACVSSYGAAGSNSALMVRQRPSRNTPAAVLQLSKYPLFISAGSLNSLSQYSKKLLDWLKNAKLEACSTFLASLSFNLADRGNHLLPHVLSTTVSSVRDLEAKLEAATAGSELTSLSLKKRKPVVLVFGGQESDFIGLSKDIYQSSTVIRKHLDSIDNMLVSAGLKSFYPCIFESKPIQDLVTLHSALFAIQYASAKAWMDCGLTIDVVIGHSFGQLTALCISGVLSLPDALRLVSGRASLMQKHWGSESGSMLSLQANRTTVNELLRLLTSENRDLYAEIACYNGPETHIVVGSSKAIEFLQQHIANTPRLRQIRNKKLNVTHGFHSRFTEPMLPHLESLVMQLEWTTPKTYLETTDEFESNTEPNFSIVSEHTRQPVFFQRAIERLTTKFSKCTWIEAGRGSSILQLVKNSVANLAGHTFHAPKLTSSAEGQDSLTDITVDLWKHGLPPIQFEKTRHWLEFKGRDLETGNVKGNPVKEVEATHELLTFFEFRGKARHDAILHIDPHADRFKLMLSGHIMAGQALCPASLYFEIVARAALYLQNDTQATTFVPRIDDLIMKSPIGQSTTKKISLTLTTLSDMPPSWSFSITTQEMEGSMAQPFEHTTGRVCLKLRDDAQAMREFKRYENLSGSGRYEEVMNNPDAEKMQGSHIYRAFNNVVFYGKPFHGIQKIANVGLEAAGKVRITPALEDPAHQRLTDTPMTDSFMQFAGFLVNYFNNPSFEDVSVCMKIEHIEIGGAFDPDAKEWLVHAIMSDVDTTEAMADAYVFDARTKKMVMAAFGFHFSKMPQSSLVRILRNVNKSAANNKAPVKTVKSSTAAANVGTAATSDPTQTQPAILAVKNPVGKRGELLQLLSNITDVPLEELKDSTTLEDIGIDSLMATEVLNEIRASFGLTIDLSSFLFFPSLRELILHVNEKLGINGADEDAVTAAATTAATGTTIVTLVESPSIARAVEATTGKRQELLQLLSDVTDTPLEQLKDDTTLEDIGIDSLMATEVLNEIRSNFGLSIDLSSFLFFPSLRDLVTHVNEKLGITIGDDDGALISTPISHEDSLTGTTGTDTPNTEYDPTTLEEVKNTDEPKTASLRPYITSALDAFEEIRFSYDRIAESTQGIGFWEKTYPYQARLVLAYIVEAFADLNCDLTKIGAGDVLPQIKALGRHTQLVRHLYRILEDGKLVISSEDKKSFVRTSVPVDPTPAEIIHSQIIDLFPQHANAHKLLQAVGSKLAACLRGESDGMQIIFGSQDTKKILEEFYEFWPFLRTPTLVLGNFLTKAFTTKATGEGKFRILELGAGTGGTTRYIINHLRQQGIDFEYVFTDLSTSLVKAATKHFRGTEGLSFDVLDIEKPPTSEYEAEFHCIIASNIVHATRNLDLSLKHAQRMLRDDGFVALIEFTQDIFWLDIVFGQFEGWWSFDDGREHALSDEKHWERKMLAAGFSEVSWSEGAVPESKTSRVIAAFSTGKRSTSKKAAVRGAMETVVYKQIGDLKIHADVYYPAEGEPLPERKMPVALMIHGGSHMLFSRKDVRPAQTRLLLGKDFLPVSLDYRLCPEVALTEGAMVDVRDALAWARNDLPGIQLRRSGLQIDGNQVVVVGWSSGGQLAMSLAWTAPQLGLPPPKSILAFYAPTDYEDEWWRNPIYPAGVPYEGQQYDVLEGVNDGPVTNYDLVGAWEEPISDPRSFHDARTRTVLHINWKAQTLPVILNGLPSRSKAPAEHPDVKDWNTLPQPSLDLIRAASPRAHISQGSYNVPTFFIHGTADDLIPWQQSQRTYQAMVDKGIDTGLVFLENSPHICDLSSDPKSDSWKAILKAYDFLCSYAS
ncbi:hypothetical protein EV356DRAFT_579785 [Viridothelium virens]|uniref:Polyketide synthase n=1 Tax=Viridothelium virens TaxID=1048519 RepID=A0A6A6GYJ0_VIRVR|nr:hypothetical protein EV356DRAFT_579785 [Viridothelium virens]